MSVDEFEELIPKPNPKDGHFPWFSNGYLTIGVTTGFIMMFSILIHCFKEPTDASVVLPIADKIKSVATDNKALPLSAGTPVEKAENNPKAGLGESSKPQPFKVPSDALQTASGLKYTFLEKGSGVDTPLPDDAVKIKVSAWSEDGKPIPASKNTKSVIQFGLGQSQSNSGGVIPAWTEAIALLRVGDQARFWIPKSLAGKGGVDTSQTLIHDITLVDILPAPNVPPLQPPEQSKKTKDGVAYDIYKKGPGKTKPKALSSLHVLGHIWDSDGSLLFSSTWKGEPLILRLSDAQFPKELKRSLLLLHEGDSGRFWIPKSDAKSGDDSDWKFTVDLAISRVDALKQMPLSESNPLEQAPSCKASFKWHNYCL